AVPMGLSVIDEERFARPDTSVAGQVLKLVAANPDAILVGASGTAAALPQTTLRERGYKGLIYQTHGAASMDFIRIAGPAAEGVLMASGPVMDPEDQPDEAQTKKPGLALNKAYEAKYGPNSRSQFAGHSYDASQIKTTSRLRKMPASSYPPLEGEGRFASLDANRGGVTVYRRRRCVSLIASASREPYSST